MIKILFVVSTLQRSGPVFVLYNIIKYLDKAKYDITVLTLSPEKNDSIRNWFDDLSIRILSLNLSRYYYLINARYLFNKILQEVKPDIIHSHCIRADILASRINLIPTITTIHGELLIDNLYQYGSIIGRFVTHANLSILNRFTAVIACSKTVSKFLQQNKIRVSAIPNGVDTDVYKAVDISMKAHLRAKLGLPDNKKIILSVGSLITRKNPLFIIESFKRFDADCLLIFLGTGYGKSSLEDECKVSALSDSRILFKGKVNNVNEYLCCCDYFISASYSEGLPNAALEALACGLPVILSNIPSHNEILELNLNAGVLFDQNMMESLHSEMRCLLNRNYSNSSSAAQNLITSNLSAAKMSSCYSDIYQNICK